MTIIQENGVKSKLQQIGLCDFSILCFMEAVNICERKKLHILDINLKQTIYPALEAKFEKSRSTIETMLGEDISSVWNCKKYKNKIKKLFKYNKKPTVKKLIILLELSI